MELQDLLRVCIGTLQWLPNHCGIIENEKADTLSKAGSKWSSSATFRETKKHHSQLIQLQEEEQADPIYQLQSADPSSTGKLATADCRTTDITSRFPTQINTFYFLQLYCPDGISPMGNSGCLPRGKPSATELRYNNLLCMLGVLVFP